MASKCLINNAQLNTISNKIQYIITKNENNGGKKRSEINNIRSKINFIIRKRTGKCEELEKLLFRNERSNITRQYSIVEYINCGSYGCVFGIYDKQNNNDLLVIKIVYLLNDSQVQDFKKEFNINKKMAGLGVGPPIYKINNNDYIIINNGQNYPPKIGLFVLKKLTITLESYLKSKISIPIFVIKDTTKKIIRNIQILYDNNISHDDMHLENIMLDIYDDNVYLIDYGYVREGFNKKYAFYLYDVYVVSSFIEIYYNRERNETLEKKNYYNMNIFLFYYLNKFFSDQYNHLQAINNKFFLTNISSLHYFIQYVYEKKTDIQLYLDKDEINKKTDFYLTVYFFNLFKIITIQDIDNTIIMLFDEFAGYHTNITFMPYSLSKILENIYLETSRICADIIEYIDIYKDEPCLYAIKTLYYNPVLRRVDIDFDEKKNAEKISFFDTLIMYFDKLKRTYHEQVMNSNFSRNRFKKIIQEINIDKNEAFRNFSLNLKYNRLCYISDTVYSYFIKN